MATDLATSYLWQARLDAGRHDPAGFRAANERFFLWGDRARADLHSSPASSKAKVRSLLNVARSLMAPILAAPGSASEGGRADSVLNDIDNQSQEQSGEHQDGG